MLCRLSDDEYALGDGLCTHAKVHLADGALVDGQIECPKHNGRFDARTGDADAQAGARGAVHVSGPAGRWATRQRSRTRAHRRSSHEVH